MRLEAILAALDKNDSWPPEVLGLMVAAKKVEQLKKGLNFNCFVVYDTRDNQGHSEFTRFLDALKLNLPDLPESTRFQLIARNKFSGHYSVFDFTIRHNKLVFFCLDSTNDPDNIDFCLQIKRQFPTAISYYYNTETFYDPKKQRLRGRILEADAKKCARFALDYAFKLSRIPNLFDLLSSYPYVDAINKKRLAQNDYPVVLAKLLLSDKTHRLFDIDSPRGLDQTIFLRLMEELAQAYPELRNAYSVKLPSLAPELAVLFLTSQSLSSVEALPNTFKQHVVTPQGLTLQQYIQQYIQDDKNKTIEHIEVSFRDMGYAFIAQYAGQEDKLLALIEERKGLAYLNQAAAESQVIRRAQLDQMQLHLAIIDSLETALIELRNENQIEPAKRAVAIEQLEQLIQLIQEQSEFSEYIIYNSLQAGLVQQPPIVINAVQRRFLVSSEIQAQLSNLIEKNQHEVFYLRQTMERSLLSFTRNQPTQAQQRDRLGQLINTGVLLSEKSEELNQLIHDLNPESFIYNQFETQVRILLSDLKAFIILPKTTLIEPIAITNVAQVR